MFNGSCAKLHYELHDDEIVCITDGTRELVLRSVFPDLREDRGTWQSQVPREPLAQFSATHVSGFNLPDDTSRIPLLYGSPEISKQEGRIDCNADLFGGIFFLLSRFEEIISTERDIHDRFPASASLSYREGFLERPLADIYREIVFSLISQLWPGWRESEESVAMQVSCDVDEPLDRSVRNPFAFIRTLGGDILKRRCGSLALKRVLNYALRGVVGTRFDPCYTFDWYMEQCEAQGLKAIFYFIAGHSAGFVDGTYEIDDPRIIDLFRTITRRGHAIGMHGSYNTFNDPELMKWERSKLNAALQKAGLAHDVVENRQHYLRWDASATPDHLYEAGFRVDASGGFADMPGFRFGTARRFRMWSWRRLEPLDLVQKPLIVMEGSLLSPLYLQLNNDEALEMATDLRHRTEKYGGEFSLLWHNSELETYRQRALFAALIRKTEAISEQRSQRSASIESVIADL